MIADVAFYASIAAMVGILLVVVRDWRRGKTALGKLVLERDKDPDRFWMALALYANIGFALLWLGQQFDSKPEGCNPFEEECIIINGDSRT